LRSVACMWWMGYYSLPRPTALKPRYEPRARSTELQSYLLATIQLSSFSTWKPECKLLFIVNLLSVLNHILLPTTLLWLCENIYLLFLFWHIWISALHISSLTPPSSDRAFSIATLGICSKTYAISCPFNPYSVITEITSSTSNIDTNYMTIKEGTLFTKTAYQYI